MRDRENAVLREVPDRHSANDCARVVKVETIGVARFRSVEDDAVLAVDREVGDGDERQRRQRLDRERAAREPDPARQAAVFDAMLTTRPLRHGSPQ